MTVRSPSTPTCSRGSNAMSRWRRCTSRTTLQRSAPFSPHSPDLPQVACFDTAFHRGHTAVVDHFAIPERFYAEGVRRYGFHGLSYEYIAGQLPEVAAEIASGRVIVAHLGSGASMCALAGGRSIESTMGFTAIDGLPMGTRPGQIDPGVVLYLIEQKGMSAAEVQELFYHECGLKGLSGISNDVRELETSSDPAADFALDYFCYRVGLYTGMLASALGGLDAFVFTAGIGENSASIRSRIAARLRWLGVELELDGECGACPADIPAQQSDYGLCHSDRRGIDDRAPHTGGAVGEGRTASLRLGSSSCSHDVFAGADVHDRRRPVVEPLAD